MTYGYPSEQGEYDLSRVGFIDKEGHSLSASSHSYPAISTVFDDANLVSCAGLAPTMALAHRAGLGDLVADTLTLKAEGGANAHLKIPALVAGMVAGADCIDDMDLLRHGGMDRLFTGIRAPSTLGTFLRTFTFGHVRQLDAVASRFLAALAKNAPILPGADQSVYVDIDDTIKATHGYAKQGAGYGYTNDDRDAFGANLAVRRTIVLRTPVDRVDRFPIWPAAQQVLPRTRPSTVADVHNHA
jgi:hypothetical protein